MDASAATRPRVNARDAAELQEVEEVEPYRSYRQRLQSFHVQPVYTVSAYDLAEAGFYGSGNMTRCFFCKAAIPMAEWKDGDIPAKRHAQEFPSCLYAKKILYIERMKSLANRVQSFAKFGWTLSLAADRLAKAGLFCRADLSTMCAYCKTTFRRWRETDDPLERHANKSPCCPFILHPPRYALEHVEIAEKQREIQDQLKHLPPKVPSMASPDARRASFNTWPGPIDPDALVQAGLFYLRVSDWTQCFHCGGGLEKWVAGDVPQHDHAKHYPHCEYVKLNNFQSGPDECSLFLCSIRLGTAEEAEEEEEQQESEGARALPPPSDEAPGTLHCRVCAVNEMSVVFLPCKHLCCCPGCAAAMPTCPICRSKIEHVLRVHVG